MDDVSIDDPGAGPTTRNRALLFDFFGTLVDYQPDRARLGYPRTHALLTSWGPTLGHDEFVALWDRASRLLEAESRRTLREYSMADAATAFARQASLDLPTDRCAELGASFVREWQQHVVPVDGAAEMIDRLARRWSVAIVSNTHDRRMVPDLLGGMGLSGLDEVVLSIDHGRCKPHPSIYRAALSRLAVGTEDAVFVGDSFEADYVGPTELGITSYLIDPGQRHDLPPDRRLRTVLDIEATLGR